MPKTISGEFEDIEIMERDGYRAITFKGLFHRLCFMPDALGDGFLVEVSKAGEEQTALLPHEHAEALHAFLTDYLQKRA